MATKELYSNKQKAAMLLIALGPEKSTKIFKYLKEEEIEDLTLEIASIKAVSPRIKEEVLQEFYELCLAQNYIAEGGIDYAKQLLENALGADKAIDIINKLTVSLQVRPFEFARKTEPAQLVNFIQNEHPQTIALILSYLKPSQSAEIIRVLSPEMQADIARRIALMDRASPEVIAQIEKEFEKRLSTLVSEDYTSIGGIDSIVEIINQVDRTTEKNIMENLEIEDPELSEVIKKKMFVFEDIVTLDSKSIQRVLREVDNHQLAIALKGTGEEVKQIVMENISKRLGAMIEEDLEYMGPKRMKEIEDAQQKIVNIIRKLEDTGEVIISRGAGDEVVV